MLALSSYFAAWPPLPTLQTSSEGLRSVHLICLVAGLLVPLAIQALLALRDGQPLMLLRKGLTAEARHEL